MLPPRASSAATPAVAGPIERVRGFNRFYTRQLGLLGRRLLGSDFTLTEARVLYELAHAKDATATAIARELALDAAYLSRILKRFERERLIERTPSRADARQRRLKLTAAGRRAFLPLERAARQQVAGLLEPMSPRERGELVGAMDTVGRLLGANAAAGAYRLRDLQLGDVGWIVHRQGLLYAQEYGWDHTYEGMVAEILGAFVKSFDAAAERAWIAERDGCILGSVFLVRASRQVAKLRLLYVEPAARGLGIGRHLVAQCIAFARARGYRTLTLWTNDVLVAARRIYEAAGFELKKAEAHHSFGKDLIGQTWELRL